MDYKKIIRLALLPLIALASVSVAAAQAPVTINGSIDIQAPYTPPASIQLYAVNEGALVLLAETEVDAQSKFTFTFTPSYKGYYVVGWDRALVPAKKYRFYFEGGETLDLTLGILDYRLTGERNSKENRILADWDEASADVRHNSVGGIGFFRETYETFFPRITRFAAENTGWFEGKQTGNLRFDALMEQTVPLEILFWATNFMSMPNRAHPETKDYRGTFYETIDAPAATSDTTLLRMPFGMRTLTSLVYLPYRIKGMSGTRPGTDDLLGSIGNDRLKSLYLLDMAASYRSYDELDDFTVKYAYYLSAPEYRQKIDAFKSTLEKQNNEMSGVNFTYTDIKGNKVSLGDFRGKVVYLDFWATWCAPCRAELPYLKKVEEHYEGNDNVVFIGISTDKPADKEKWAKMVREEKLPGVQLFAGGPDRAPEEYKISGIPRFILIDRQGKVVAADAPRPSSGEMLIKAIDKLLK